MNSSASIPVKPCSLKADSSAASTSPRPPLYWTCPKPRSTASGKSPRPGSSIAFAKSCNEMDDARLKQIQALFLEVSELPETERPAFLETACGDDGDLKNEVLGMVNEDSRTDSLLDGDVAEAARGLLNDAGETFTARQFG